MQILTREGKYESRSASPYQPWGSTAPPAAGFDGGNFGGIQINERTALQLAAVWGSVSLISDSISALPIQQFRMVAGEAKQMDCAQVIEQPWSEFTQRDFIQQGTVSMLLRGNLWGRKIGLDDRGNPTQVQLVHPNHARIHRDQSSGQLKVKYWNDDIPFDQVTRAMALTMPEGIEGLSPIEFMRNSLGLARAQDLASAAFYANSARPNGLLKVNGDLDPEETKTMLEAWLAAHQGINHLGLPAILTGDVEWQPISMSMADAQFLEQMQYSAQVISGMIYRVPPHMLGMVDKDTSWGAGIEQQMLGYVRDALGIWLRRWEDLMRSWLPPRQFVVFDLSQRLRGDALQRWSAYQIARVIGAMNGAEVRAAEGLPKVTDPAAVALLEAYDTPFTSAPVKAPSSSGVGPGGDKSD